MQNLNAANAYATQLLELLQSPDLLRATFAGTPRFAKTPIQRATLRPVDLREGRRLQLSRNDGRKDISTNHTPEELAAALAEILAAGFSNVHIRTQHEEIDLRLTKKGDLLIGRRPAEGPADTETAHNRTKDVPLPEGRADAVLEAMGILDRNHRVRPTMRDKFTQINEFLKLLVHVLPEVTEHRQNGDAGRPLTILDCGCGSSHLTLATAHYLNDVLQIPARVVGIDANAEVIEKSRTRAASLSCPIEFRSARIGEVTDIQADIVLALHACDTATDDALTQAVRSNAKLILAVPCCHKDLNAKLHIPVLAPIHHHGILHHRLADIVTDTFRALLLEVMGYRTEIIEFISPEHTARNLMIRAVRIRDSGDKKAVDRYVHFKQTSAVTPHLENALAHLLPGDLLKA